MLKKLSPLKHNEVEGEVLHNTLTKKEHDEKHGVEEEIEEEEVVEEEEEVEEEVAEEEVAEEEIVEDPKHVRRYKIARKGDDEYKDYKGNIRNIDGEKGVYLQYNPEVDNWVPIAPYNFKQGVKRSGYNEEAGYWEEGWGKEKEKTKPGFDLKKQKPGFDFNISTWSQPEPQEDIVEEDVEEVVEEDIKEDVTQEDVTQDPTFDFKKTGGLGSGRVPSVLDIINYNNPFIGDKKEEVVEKDGEPVTIDEDDPITTPEEETESWKDEYFNITGSHPDNIGITKETARKTIDKAAIGANVEQTPLVEKILNTPTHVVDANENPVNVNDLDATDLAIHRDNIYERSYEDYFDGDDFAAIYPTIEEALKPYANDLIKDLQVKYNLNDPIQVEMATREFSNKYDIRFDEILNANEDYQEQTEEIENTVNNIFTNRISYLSKAEKLDAMNLPEIAKTGKGFIGSAWRQAAVMFPKAYNDWQQLTSGIKIEEVEKMLVALKKLDPEKVVYMHPMMEQEEKISPGRYKVGDLIPKLETISLKHRKRFWDHMVRSQEYQDMLDLLPKQGDWFDDDGNFEWPSFTETKGMFGTQFMQILVGALTGTGSTVAQEAGGAFDEIMNIKAAEKAKLMGLDYNNIPNQLKAAIWLDIIEKGEGDLDMAMSTGATNALLELTEAALVLPKLLGVKPSDFIPTKFMRDIIQARFKKALTPVAKGIYGATVPSIQSGLTEVGQELSTVVHVGNATGQYEHTKERYWNSFLTALIIPAPLIGANYTIQKTTRSTLDIIDQFRGKPNEIKTVIAKAKAKADQKFNDNIISKEKRDKIYDALETIEDQAYNNQQFFNLNQDQKEDVVNKLLEKKLLEGKRNKLQNKIDRRNKLTKHYKSNNDIRDHASDMMEVEKINEEIGRIDELVKIESLVSSTIKSARGIAKYINDNQTDPNFKDKKFKVFTTIKELENAMKDKDQFMEDYGIDLNDNNNVATLETLIEGQRNAANFGNTAIAIEEVIIDNIRNKKDIFAANAIYHDGLHFILDNIPTQDLQEMGMQMLLELETSKDPQVKAAATLMSMRLADYQKKMPQRIKEEKLTPQQAERILIEEMFTSMSDALQYVHATDLTTEGGVTFSRIGDLINDVAKDVMGKRIGIDYTALRAGDALDFIKGYNVFNGTGIYFGPKFKGGRMDEDDPTTKMSESIIVDKINDIYEKKGLLGYEDIIKVLEAGGNHWVDGEYRGPGQAKDIIWRNTTRFNRRPNYPLLKQDVYTDILYDPVYGVQTAIMRFKPGTIGKDGKPVTMAKHIFGWLKLKPIDIANKRLGKVKDTVFTKAIEGLEDIITDPTTEDVVETREERQVREEKEIQPKLMDNLDIDKKITIEGKQTTYRDYVIDKLRTIIAQELPLINTTTSKNKKTSDFISTIKKKLGDRLEGGQFGTIDFMGRKGIDFQNFLIDNKPFILKGMTTSWLSRNFPEAIEKSVGGTKVYGINPETGKREVIGFNPKFVKYKNWKGKKIDKEIAAVHKRTAQHQIMRRNPQAIAAVTDFDKNFIKVNNKTGTVSPIQSKQEGLATQIIGELGLELLHNDFANKGPLYELFKNKEELRGRIVSENIANEISKDIERGGVKMSESFALLPEDERAIFYDLLPVLGQELANHGNNVRIAFNKTYKDPDLFGDKMRDKIIKDLEKYVDTYLEGKKLYDLIGAPIQPLTEYIINETAMRDFDKSYKQMLGLAKDAMNFRDINQIDSAIKAVEKIAHIIGYEKADRFLRPILSSSGKIGGTKYTWIPDIGYVIDAMFDQNKIDKLEKSLQKAKDEGKPKATIKSWENKIKKAKQRALTELESLRTGLFAGREHWDARIGVGFKEWIPKYKNNIPVDASQSVNVDVSTPAKAKVNKDSANRNKEFLIELSDICRDLLELNKMDPKKGITLNDYAMIMKSIQGGTSGPLFAAAHVSHTVDGPIKSSTHTYEHLIPRDVVQMYLGDYVTGKTTKADIKKLLDQFSVAIVPDKQAEIFDAHYKSSMPAEWSLGDNVLKRYFNLKTFGKINLKLIDVTTGQVDPKSQAFVDAYNAIKKKNEENKILDEAIKKSRVKTEPKGITVLDFDDTLATTESLVKFTRPDGTTGTLNAEQYANTYEDLLDKGYTFDFSDFNKVVKGKLAPLFNKAIKLQNKFGPENMFVLTARPPQAAKAIFDFLKANGLNIPLKNITGLANSTSEAKALWIADKVGEGYNDFYFADDALQNVQAVQNMLDQFDVKSKVQQAKVKFSESMSVDFNDILEGSTGIESQKQFSDAQAKIRGAKTKYKSIIPASAQDFQGLLYSFLGKGKKGEADMAFFKKALIDPFARGINELNSSRQTAANDFKNLNKAFPKIKKLLNKSIEGMDYTHDQAIRVYLWDKAGFEIPGLSKRDLAGLTSFVQNNPELQSYADAIGLISKKDEGYSQPKDYWLAESITSDLLSDGAIGDVRSNFLAEWIENKNTIFSPENLNKIEAIYGSKFREALEDMLYRMETGRSRPMGGGRLVNSYMNWVNNSVGAIMFFNIRSATLQTISAANYMNWTDNNPAKAGLAFANQPQYWKDFVYIFNSDYLKQRRAGNQRGINEAELSEAVAASDNKAKTAIAWLLKKGFKPTQIADSFAISSGGATFYRNRVKTYEKQGMSTKDAEAKAWLDFQEITEVSQQSARPDMISQQQASPLGRLILSFQNTPMQYARIMNKAARDLAAGRGDYKTHISKIVYYGTVQSIIFGALQSALYASLGDDDEEQFDKKKERILNQMVDSWLTGMGYSGKAIGTIKNTIMEYLKQRDKGFRADHAYTLLQLLGFSPPIGSKLRKVYRGIKEEQWSGDVFMERGFTLDNPIWSATGNVIEGVTNAPLGRLSNLMLQLDNAMDPTHQWWQRVALILGQNTWDLGIQDPDIEKIKIEIIAEKRNIAKERAQIKKQEEKIDNLRKQYPNKTDNEINEILKIKEKNKEVFDLNKREQVKILEANNLNPKDYPKEKDRVDAIMNLRKKNESKIDSALTAIKNYVPTEQEQRSIELFKMTKKDQVNLLMELGVSTKVIKNLKYEEDRVKKIIELQNKVKKAKNK